MNLHIINVCAGSDPGYWRSPECLAAIAWKLAAVRWPGEMDAYLMASSAILGSHQRCAEKRRQLRNEEKERRPA